MAKLPKGFWSHDRCERVRALLAGNVDQLAIAEELQITPQQLYDAIRNRYLAHPWSRSDGVKRRG